MISMDKKYKTRDGRDVRVLCVDGPDIDFPVVGYMGADVNPSSWARNGCFDAFYDKNIESKFDLIEVKEKLVRWVNVYGLETGSAVYNNKEFANDSAAAGRIACIKIEFEEGEGL